VIDLKEKTLRRVGEPRDYSVLEYGSKSGEASYKSVQGVMRVTFLAQVLGPELRIWIATDVEQSQ
jgi:hypothetical protein